MTRRQMAREMTEDELLDAVLGALRQFGWIVVHTRRSDAGIVQGDPGEPDIRGVRNGSPLWIECKGTHGRLTTAQADWLYELALVPGAIVRVLRPRDLDPFLRELMGRAGGLSTLNEALSVELRRADLGTVS